jgi:hypothetical protein
MKQKKQTLKLPFLVGWEPLITDSSLGDDRRAMRSAGPRILAYVSPTHTQESNTMTRCYRRGNKTPEKKKHVYQGYIYLYEHQDF